MRLSEKIESMLFPCKKFIKEHREARDLAFKELKQEINKLNLTQKVKIVPKT